MSLPPQLTKHCVLLKVLHVNQNPPLVGLPLSLPNLSCLEKFTCDESHLNPTFYEVAKGMFGEGKVHELFNFVAKVRRQ
jgi:hypothetical protein